MKSIVILLALSVVTSMQPDGAVALKYKKFLIRQVRFYWGAKQEVSIFAAQIRQESNWNPAARSPYAAGMTQFTPATARWITSRYPELRDAENPAIKMRFDWKWAIRAMVRYDFHLYNQLQRNKRAASPHLWSLTLRSYNGGIGWISKELKHCKKLDFKCCARFRNESACAENLEYPVKIMTGWKPFYERWDR